MLRNEDPSTGDREAFRHLPPRKARPACGLRSGPGTPNRNRVGCCPPPGVAGAAALAGRMAKAVPSVPG